MAHAPDRMHAHHTMRVPRQALWLAFAMCGFTIVAAGLSSYDKIQKRAARDAAVASLSEAGVARSTVIAFADRSDGSIAVLDGKARLQIAAVEPNEDGFVRGVLRGFARERQAHGIGPVPPFELSYTQEGMLILFDPETGREVVLNAFGPDNVRAFGRLLFAQSEGGLQ